METYMTLQVPYILGAVYIALLSQVSDTRPHQNVPTSKSAQPETSKSCTTLVELLGLLSTLPELPNNCNQEWRATEYVNAARIIEGSHPILVHQALERFLYSSTLSDQLGREGRLYVLLRIAFDTQAAPADRPTPCFALWTSATALDRANPSWPVAWQDGRPELLSPLSGREGLPYRAGTEYSYFLGNYPFRQELRTNRPPGSDETNQVITPTSIDEIVQSIDALRPIPISQEHDAANWRPYLIASRRIQSASIEDVRVAIGTASDHFKGNENEAVVFNTLLGVLFETSANDQKSGNRGVVWNNGYPTRISDYALPVDLRAEFMEGWTTRQYRVFDIR